MTEDAIARRRRNVLEDEVRAHQMNRGRRNGGKVIQGEELDVAHVGGLAVHSCAGQHAVCSVNGHDAPGALGERNRETTYATAEIKDAVEGEVKVEQGLCLS